MHRVIAPLVFLVACGGPNPLVGDWTCPTGSDDWTNEMTVLEDLSGDLLMHYTQASVAYHSILDHETQDRGRGLYWIDVVCAEDCPEAGKDFRMPCDLSEDELVLECDADGWYELIWERAS